MRQIRGLLIVSFILMRTLEINGGIPDFCSDLTQVYPESDSVKHHIGEFFGGGIIFYVDNSNQHGLICSMSDIRDPASAPLFNRQDSNPLKGRSDSAILINQVFSVDNPDRAQVLCDNYTNSNYGNGIFSDWRLPTCDELEILYKVKNEVNKLLESFNKSVIDPLVKCYWSSTKMYDNIFGDVWLFDFHEGGMAAWAKNRKQLPGKYFVRAVRAF